MSGLKYILDANIFITAAKNYYSFDFGNTFWDFLLENAQKGVLCSIDKVLKEIEQGDDELKNWAITKFNSYFYPTNNNNILTHYSDIAKYINSLNSPYKKAIDEFLKENNSDAWVIAFAKAKNLIVVTEERSNPQAKRKIFIPDVCNHFKINYIDTFQMLKELNFKL